MDKPTNFKFPPVWGCVVFDLYEPLYEKTGGHCKYLPFKNIAAGELFVAGQLPPGHKKRILFYSFKEILDHCRTETDPRILKCAEAVRWKLEQIAKKAEA